MFERILGGTRWQEILQEIENRESYTKSERTFFNQKVNSVFTGIRETLNTMMTDGSASSKVPLLWLNMLEAAHYDFKMGTHDNTAVALELAKYMNRLPHLARHKILGRSLRELESRIRASLWFSGECLEIADSVRSVYF